MSEFEKAYTHGEITVIWKPGICLHSGRCVRGLGEVFNVNAHPWIDLGAAKTARIIEQVRQCPSGALRYVQQQKVAKAAG